MWKIIHEFIFGVRLKGEEAYNETHFRIRTIKFKNRPSYKEWKKQLNVGVNPKRNDNR